MTLPARHPSRSSALPSPPSALVMVLKACGDPNVPLSKLARMVSSEPSLAMELLRVANSGFYGGRSVCSAQQAVVLLGARAVRNHAVAHVLRVAAEGLDVRHFDLDRFWQDSLWRATLALVLGQRAGCEDPWEAFTVSLIQEAGTPFIVALHPEFAQDIAAVQHMPGQVRRNVELGLIGLDHAMFLANTLTEWGLPDDLVDAVRYHHTTPPETVDRRAARLATLARIADACADVCAEPENEGLLTQALHLIEDLESRKHLTLESLISAAEEALPDLAQQHRIPIDQRPPVASVVAEAVSSMVKITHHYEQVTQQLEDLLEERQRLTRELEVRNSQLRRLATTDELTGATNRRFFMNCLRQGLEDASRSGRPISVVMLDLDRFKRINDQYGHATGDDVLVATVERLTKTVRPTDVVGRLGGEEFALLLPDTDEDEALAICERCRIALSGTPVIGRTGVRLMVSGSFGGVTARGSTNAETLLAAADLSMYDAKNEGGDLTHWAEGVQ